MPGTLAVPPTANRSAADAVREFAEAAVAVAPPLTDQQVARIGAMLSQERGRAGER